MNKILVIIVAAFALLLTGCQTAPMTAKSRLDVAGDIVVVERTTTTKTDSDGSQTVTVTENSSKKSPAAGDLELKSKELKARRDAAAARSRFWDWFFTPYINPTGGYYGGGGAYYAPYGGR